jgi:predicted phage tail protein
LPAKSGSSREVIFPTSMVPLVSKGIEFIPTADERFGKTDPMVAYFEVYEPLLARQPAAKVQVHLRIVDAKASAVGNDFQSVDVASYVESGNSTIRISRKIPTDDLPAGSYRFQVRAVDSDGVSTAWRSADFAVDRSKGRHQKTENGTSANLTPAPTSRAATPRRRPSFLPSDSVSAPGPGFPFLSGG